jgi:hypothetical protein
MIVSSDSRYIRRADLSTLMLVIFTSLVRDDFPDIVKSEKFKHPLSRSTPHRGKKNRFKTINMPVF